MINLKSVQSAGDLPAGLNFNQLISINKDSTNVEAYYKQSTNLVALVVVGSNKYVLKKFGWRNPIHFIFSPTFKSRAQASWDTALKLIAAGTQTPFPIYVHTVRKLGYTFDNIFLTSAVHPHIKFRALNLKTHSESFIISVTKSLAQSIVKMHNAGIIHNDLTNGNFLVNNEGSIFIVDLNRAKTVKQISVRQRLIDLSKINFKFIVNQEEQIRKAFFDTYSENCSIFIDLENEYISYRKKRLRKRRLKKKIKGYFYISRMVDSFL
ncbi:lipopolysaccharide kinase InaA family protein [Candidatus Neomarinimicrobiota bacterium]